MTSNDCRDDRDDDEDDDDVNNDDDAWKMRLWGGKAEVLGENEE